MRWTAAFLVAGAACASSGSALAAARGECFALAKGVRAGEFLTAEMAESIPCRDERPDLPLAFDRDAGAPVAKEDLPAGTYLGQIALRLGRIARAGETLQLVIRHGPVIVEREVRPIRSLRAGERGFVRAADGEVLTARFVDAGSAE